MSYLLHLETSTKVCSVALSKNNNVISIMEENSPDFSHSSQLTVFIQKVMDKAGISFQDLSGVSVSSGPGSYTGLRIGTSAAKGLCYALDIPLISVSTLKSMAFIMMQSEYYSVKKIRNVLLCPMIDARRMEVYNAIFDNKLRQLKPVSADVIDKDSFAEFMHDKPVWFFGDGASKCKSVISGCNAIFFDDVFPSASGMASLAYDMFINQQFEDTAYFEPFYLKDFVAGKPKVKGLYS